MSNIKVRQNSGHNSTTKSYRTSSAKGRYGRRRGATLVEFALCVPVLLAILLGILEFAWLAKNHLTISNAAREGARAASLGKTTDEITARIKNMSDTLPGVNDSTRYSFDYSYDDPNTSGYSYTNTLGNSSGKNNAPTGALIRVQCTYVNKGLTGMFPFLNKTIVISVIMRREA
jgi:hypothetical protein